MTRLERASAGWKPTALPLDDIRSFQLSKSWRPWLKSNQQHAVLETAAAPPPHGRCVSATVRCVSASRTSGWEWRFERRSRGSQPRILPVERSPTYDELEPVAGLEPASLALQGRRSASRTRPASHRRDSNARHLDTNEASCQLNDDGDDLEATTGLEPARTRLRDVRAATRTPWPLHLYKWAAIDRFV